MEIVYLLVPITLILVAVGVAVFSWAVKSGQYDDLEGPAHRILYDDDQDMIPDDAKTERQKSEELKKEDRSTRPTDEKKAGSTGNDGK
ncbi:cbb3-type cytochrome oxidase assembly protein CcoS [Marinobacter nanhaiticus D15-8W]|uniref:Cbb3-type cytochrome oxidase assembly protein CcoS n=1 Tax=Marinobacter nanhaiticus D15-8W TaxID=626887 RepID=N6VU94_9GAMM|nr:cbb3-type cytochrome oxidase assembly protein CcoS [Marinobacter nanhaiticus]ENO13700.1 cbb3-type cytochrome oxidase assembly protein CcoS [Marinobacter nanhaiticus D15-8W]BES71072.1 cbb3-type cytochrome oxidase assembly protein CcoS [Marinobacter nanhaiticus D15-8W]